MGVAKDATRSPEDVVSTPLPGETLALFYARSRKLLSSSSQHADHNLSSVGEYWAQKAHVTSDNRGKELRRDGFTLAQERYGNLTRIFRAVTSLFILYGVEIYKPVLMEVEKILAEAGLDEEEMRKGSAAAGAGVAGQSRNRR